MPNWCYNRLIVSGEKADAFERKFNIASRNKDTPRTYEYSLNSIIPIPDEVDNTSEWARKNWGTSMDMRGDVIMRRLSKEQFQYKFITVWAPPEIWLSKVSKLYSRLNFKLEFAIPMMNSSGEFVFSSGRLVKECYDECCSVSRRLTSILGRRRKSKLPVN